MKPADLRPRLTIRLRQILKLNPNWRDGKTPQQIREIEHRLVDLEKLVEENPLAAVVLLPKQQKYVGSKKFYKLLSAGNGFGKTFTGTVDDLIQLCDRDVLPERLAQFKRWEPPFHMRIVVPKFGLAESVALEKFRELTPKAQFMGGNFDKAYDKVNRKLRFANGSWVVFNTSDQDVNAHAGVELHRVRFDEEPEGELGYRIYNENLMRLRKAMPDAQVCMTFTPQNGLGWTYELFWEERGEEVAPNVFENDQMIIVVASMLDNPHIDGAALLEMANLPPEEYAARVEGKFVSFHGRVLQVNQEQRVEAPSVSHVRGLETWVGIDPGIARGGVVWVGFDRDNVALVFDELYPKDMLVPDIVKAIHEKNAYWGVTPRCYVIDPSSKNRSLTDGERVESIFLREGLATLPGQNDRRAGVMQLRARLAQDGLLISRACVDLLKETERWVVAQDEKTAEDKPSVGGDSFKTKGPDHLCFVAGTLVDTERGGVPIERVRVGERVWTRNGLEPVVAASMTSSDAETVEALLSDGTSLRGTPNHPVWVQGNGWVDLSELNSGDELLTWSNPLSSVASPFAVTPKPISALTGCISFPGAQTDSVAYVDSTRKSGRPLTETSPKAITSTTLMVTRGTTTSRTSRASRRGSISVSIGHPSAPSAVGSVWTASGRWQRSGMEAPKGSRGTPDTRTVRSLLSRRPSAPARSAAQHTSPAQSARTAFARPPASRSGGASREWMTRTVRALSAKRRSGSTVTARSRLAPVRVVAVRKAARSAVFNLSVDGTPEFFANGVLVHNCDPLRYVCMERLWYRAPGSEKKRWDPSMGGAPPASWYAQVQDKSGPPLGSMT